jgi:alginate O-acetyltransferase complex protein AlgI
LEFTSMRFLIFFPIVAVLYFAIPQRFRWIWLLISSYYFYMSWSVKYAVLIAASTIITYLGGLFIEKANNISDKKRSVKLKKLYAFLSIAINLGILFAFKCLDFFFYSIKRVFSWFDFSINTPLFNLILPLGISFYTFQAIGYIVDVYRGNAPAEKNLGKYALFISFFPKLTAGPIERSKDLMHQFDEVHSFDYDRVKDGLLLMVWGYFQKIFVADRLAILVNRVFNYPQNYKGFEVFIASIFFTFQIYCDFSGYTDIARGAAEVMGFNLSVNFERPYFAKSIKEFWRRWHITLSHWLRDYVYIPLGGSRCSKIRHYFNIMVTFLISGLWHGAGMNFVVWGGLHGIYQVVGDMLKPVKTKLIDRFKIDTNQFGYKLFQAIVTFILVDFAWIFFRADSFTKAVMMIKNMFYFNPWIFSDGSLYEMGLDSKDFQMSVIGIMMILFINILQRTKNLRVELSKQNILFRWVIYIAGAMLLLIFGVYGPAYDYQQFIYSHF